jgi:hypothetical protein
MQRAIGTYPYRHGTRHACRVPLSLFFLILPLKVVEGVGGPDSLLFSYIEV